jgi:F0F1-type ATP synthase assembly protein I
MTLVEAYYILTAWYGAFVVGLVLGWYLSKILQSEKKT